MICSCLPSCVVFRTMAEGFVNPRPKAVRRYEYGGDVTFITEYSSV